jgi:DNA-binding PadR family transcriptional regulator
MEEELAISKKVLYTVIEKLKEKKLIKVEKRKGRGTIEVNYYYLQHGDIVKLLEL